MLKPTTLLLAACAALAPATNIVINPSFETWIGNIPLGWVTSELLYPGSAVQDPNAHTGSYCVKLVGGDTSAFATSATVVSTGRSYEFAGWVRSPGALAGSFILQFTQLNATPIGSPILLPAYYSGTTYREYSDWVTAPDSAFFLSISFATLPGATAYVDDVTLDDTMLSAVEETPAARAPAAARPRKLLKLGSGQLPAGVAFDPLGRRVAADRPGVYFILPRD